MRRVRTGALAIALASAGVIAPAADYAHLPGGEFTSVLPQGATPGTTAVARVAPFELRATPVTRTEFRAFLALHPEWRRGRAPAVFADAAYLVDGPAADDGPDVADGRPVTEVSWFAAQAFCDSEGGRLPTWLEWEFAAAADETRADARGDPAWRQRILSWYAQPATAAPRDVGGPPDVHGVRDLHGLVWEWVDDFNALFVAGDSRNQGDPDTLRFCGAGAISMADRDNYAVLMRVALLSSLSAPDTLRTLGFRCVRPATGEPR